MRAPPSCLAAFSIIHASRSDSRSYRDGHSGGLLAA